MIIEFILGIVLGFLLVVGFQHIRLRSYGKNQTKKVKREIDAIIKKAEIIKLESDIEKEIKNITKK